MGSCGGKADYYGATYTTGCGNIEAATAGAAVTNCESAGGYWTSY